MSGNYEDEVDQFKNQFIEFQDKKIVIYGIGRYTAALLPKIKNFRIIGLMDKDEENIGKTMYGIPVIGKQTAAEEADLIIINTTESYWRIIYERIADLSIPIYYKNGKIAAAVEDSSFEDAYWNMDLDAVKKQIDKEDIISFDLFDTLIMRKTFMPLDVYELTQRRINKKYNIDIDFVQLRQQAANDFYLDLKEIYDIIFDLAQGKLTKEQCGHIKSTEEEIEKLVVIPRQDVVELLKYAVEQQKQVYILSDMYLGYELIIEILYPIIDVQALAGIWISSDKKMCKHDGTMWKYYKDNVVKDSHALHIGDNWKDDIEMARKFDIKTVYICKASELLQKSSVRQIVPHICGMYDSIIMGTIISKIFNSPFCLSKSKGRLSFIDFENLGYVIAAPVIVTFLLWLIRESSELNVKKLFFLARDGYFLIQDYVEIVNKINLSNNPDAVYLGISRRAVSVASIENKNDFIEVMKIPYVGRFGDYLFDRFDITVNDKDANKEIIVDAIGDSLQILNFMEPYRDRIAEKISEERKNYLRYLKYMGYHPENSAIVDLCYYGNCQYYLSKISTTELKGFYFAANLQTSNKCTENNQLIPCFQAENDPAAKDCKIFKKILFIESMLTAPYGMIRSIDENGTFICEKNKMNQNYFVDKRIMNDGVKCFIDDFIEIFQYADIKINTLFVDALYGVFLDDNVLFSDEIKKSFWADNGLVQRREFAIFE